MRDEEKKNRRKRENEQLCGRREVLFIGNGGAYRRLENAYMHYFNVNNAYRRLAKRLYALFNIKMHMGVFQTPVRTYVPYK